MIKPKPKYVDKRTDEEWLENYYSRNPIYTKDIYVRAILIAVEAEASILGVDIDISDDIVSSALDSSNAGVAIGVGNEAQRKETTLKLYNNGTRSGSVKRGDKQIDTFSYTAFGASFKWFKESEDPIPLDTRSYMRQAAEELGLIGKGGVRPSPEQQKQRMEEQMARDKIQAEFTAKSNALTDQLDEAAEALFQFEYAGVEQVNLAAGIKPHQLSYPKRKHSGFSDEHLDSAYEGALAAPKGFGFLNTGDITKDPRMEKAKGDRLKVSQVKLDILKENLETFIAHLKHADEKHSFEDEPNPLIAKWEDENGEVRALTAQELERTEIIELSSKELNRRLASNDPKDAVFGNDMIVPAINVSDLGNPEAKIASGQIFTGTLKLTPRYMSISEKVKVVGGDHTKPVDAIFLAEGVATAASLEEMVRFNPEYEGKNVLVLTSFDVGNFKNVGVALHHKYPDTPITAVADNDVRIRVDTGNRPIIAKDGGYSYITRDKQTIAGSDMPSNPKAQIDKLARNVGAESARFLNKYVMDNPNRDAEGNPIKPNMVAFIANKGEGLTDYLITPASADPTGDTPIEQRLLSPKQDLNDVVQNQKRVIREDLKRFFKNSNEEVTKSMKAAKSIEVMQDLSKTLITNPRNTLKPILDSFYDRRLAAGSYNEPPPDVTYDSKVSEEIDHQSINESNYQPIGIDTSGIQQEEPSIPVSGTGVKNNALSDNKNQANQREQFQSAAKREPTPEAKAAFEALKELEKLELQEKQQSENEAENYSLRQELDERLNELFAVELRKVIISNEGYHQTNKDGEIEKVSAVEPSDFQALKDLHPDFTKADINDLYNRSLAMPDDFDFFKFDDGIEGSGDKLSRDQLVNRLGRVINNLNEYNDNKYITEEYESRYGKLPDIDNGDIARANNIVKLPALIRSNTSTNKVFIPTFDIDRLHSSNGAEIAGGFVLEDGKLAPASDIDMRGQVNLISGTPEEELTSIIVTSSHAEAVRIGYDLRKDWQHDYTLVSAMNIDNFKEVGVKLAKYNLDVFVTMLAENNIDVKLDANKQPILTNGDYTFTGIDGKDMTASQIKADPKELAFQLDKNEGAKAAEYLKQQFIDNPARTEQGYVGSSLMSAVVINQGATPVDLIASPLGYAGKIDHPDLNPSSGYKGISKNLTALQTKGVEEKNISLKASDSALVRVNKAGITNLLLNKYISMPANESRRQISDISRDNFKAGYYDASATNDREEASKNAEKERRAAIVDNARYHMEQLDKSSEVRTTNRTADSTNSGFSANISNSTSEEQLKREESQKETAALAQKFTNSYANSDILNAFKKKPQEAETQPNLNQKPQEEPENMNRLTR